MEATKRWWGSPRFRFTKRPFSAEEVVSLRGTLPETYASDIQACAMGEFGTGRASCTRSLDYELSVIAAVSVAPQTTVCIFRVLSEQGSHRQSKRTGRTFICLSRNYCYHFQNPKAISRSMLLVAAAAYPLPSFRHNSASHLSSQRVILSSVAHVQQLHVSALLCPLSVRGRHASCGTSSRRNTPVGSFPTPSVPWIRCR